MSLSRYVLENAKESVRGYFIPDHTNMTSKEVVFENAKAECIEHLENHLQAVKSLGSEQFFSKK